MSLVSATLGSPSTSTASPPSSSSAASLATSSASTTVEHQAITSIDDSGLKMKIKRKNPAPSSNTIDGKTTNIDAVVQKQVAADGISASGRQHGTSSSGPETSVSSAKKSDLQTEASSRSANVSDDSSSGGSRTSGNPAKDGSMPTGGKTGSKGGSRSEDATSNAAPLTGRRSQGKNSAGVTESSGGKSKVKSSNAKQTNGSNPKSSSSSKKSTAASAVAASNGSSANAAVGNRSDKKGSKGQSQPRGGTTSAAQSNGCDGPTATSAVGSISLDDDEDTKDSIPAPTGATFIPIADGGQRVTTSSSTDVTGSPTDSKSSPSSSVSGSVGSDSRKDASLFIPASTAASGSRQSLPIPVVDPYEFVDAGAMDTDREATVVGVHQSTGCVASSATSLPSKQNHQPKMESVGNGSGRHSIASSQHAQMKSAASGFASATAASDCDGAADGHLLADHVETRGRRDVSVETSSVGITTDPDCLGPCEPGTSVVLEGIVWSESSNGILVVNVTWRGKTYVGTLMDSTKHDWAPPRFRDDSPSSEENHSKSWRGAGGHGGRSASGTPDVTCTEGRRLRKCRRDAAALTGTGTSARARQPPAAAPGANDAGGRRESKNKARGTTAVPQSTPAPVAVPESIPSTVNVPQVTAPVTSLSSSLLECPAPNCSKKFRDQSGLQYHQSHAHRRQGDTIAVTQPLLDSFVNEPDCKQVNGHQMNNKHSLVSELDVAASAVVVTDTAVKSSSVSSPTGKRTLPAALDGGDGTPASKRQRVDIDDVTLGSNRIDDHLENVDGVSAAATEQKVSVKHMVKDEPVELLTNIKRESDAGFSPPGDCETASKDVPDGSATNFRKSKESTSSKDQLLRPSPNAVDGKPVGGEAISPAYSDISDTTAANADGGSAARPSRGDHHSLLDHGTGRHPMNGRLQPTAGTDHSSKDVVGSRSTGMGHQPTSADIAAGIDRHKRTPDPAQVHSLGATTPKDRSQDSTSKTNPGQQQQAAAMEYIQMESMRQAYLQMYGGGSSSPGLPPGPGVTPPFGFGVDPAMAYRMQLMAAAAAAAGGPREFNSHLEHWMATAAAAASGGHHRGMPGSSTGLFPGLDPGGPPILGPVDSKPVDMSAKRMQSSTPTDRRSRSPSGSGSVSGGLRDGGGGGRSQTPLSGSGVGGVFRQLGETPNANSNHHQPQSRGSSSHSSHHRDRHGATSGRSHSGSSGRADTGSDGHSSSSSSSRIPPLSVGFDGSSGNDPTPPLLQRRPDDLYDGPSSAALHRRSLDLMQQQQQQQLPRHRGGGSTTPSSGSNRATTPRGGLFPASRDDDKLPSSGTSSSATSSASSRWNQSSSKDAAAFAGRTIPAAGGVPGSLPSGPGSSPIPSPVAGTCGPYTPGPPASGHHRESPQTKRHVHTHHHTHVINAAYPVYAGQYSTTLLPGAAPLVPAVVFPDAYNPK